MLHMSYLCHNTTQMEASSKIAAVFIRVKDSHTVRDIDTARQRMHRGCVCVCVCVCSKIKFMKERIAERRGVKIKCHFLTGMSEN